MTPLKGPQYEMPDFVRAALIDCGLMEANHNRLVYQQNDHIGWITRAKRQKTQKKNGLRRCWMSLKLAINT